MTKIIRILNVVYMAIATVAIIFFFCVPFVDASVNVTINNEFVLDLIQKNVPGAETLKMEDVFVNNEKVEATIKLNVTPVQLVESYTDKSQQNIQTYFITPNCSDLVDALLPQIKNVAQALLRISAQTSINSQIDDYNNSHPDSPISVPTEQINEATNQILDSLGTQGATTDSVSQVIYEQVTNIIKENSDSEEEPNINQEEIRDTLTNVLNEYGLLNPDGTIKNDDGTVNQILYDLITNGTLFPPNPDGSNPSTSSVPSSSEPKSLNSNDNTITIASPTNTKTEEDVKNALSAKLTTLLGDQFIVVTTTVFKGMFVALIVFIITWGFLLVYTLIRTFRKKKCYTFIGPVFWIVGFFEIALGIGLKVASQYPFDLTSMIGQLNIFESIKPNISFSALIPGILVLVCIPLTIVYKHYKKKLKKQNRIDAAVDKKLAQIKGN